MGAPGDPVVFELGLRDAERLLDDPSLARYRYEGLQGARFRRPRSSPALAAAALLADRTISVAIIAAGLFALCLRAPRGRRWPYLVGTLASGLVLFLLSPLVARYGGVVYWEGPRSP